MNIALFKAIFPIHISTNLHDQILAIKSKNQCGPKGPNDYLPKNYCCNSGKSSIINQGYPLINRGQKLFHHYKSLHCPTRTVQLEHHTPPSPP